MDLGLIERIIAGRLRVQASAQASVAFVQRESGYAAAMVALNQGRGVSKELPVGQYLVYVWGENVPLASETVRMNPEQDAEVFLEDRPGVEVRITYEGEAKPGRMFWAEWRNQAGQLLVRQPILWREGRSLQKTVVLADGDYSVQVVGDDGEAGERKNVTVAASREVEVAVGLPRE